MRLSAFPYVTVRVACSRVPRRGAYRLARLADRYGAEITLPYLIEALAADCKLREGKRPNIYDRCGAYFPDIGGFGIVYNGGSGEADGVSVDYFIGAKRLDGDSFSAVFTIEKRGGSYMITFAPDNAPGVKRAEQSIEEGRDALIRMIDEDYRENCIDPVSHAKLC